MLTLQHNTQSTEQESARPRAEGLGARLQGATVPGDDFVDTAQHLLDGVDWLEGEGSVSAVVAQVARGAQIAR